MTAKERVVAELEELNQKYNALGDFIGYNTYEQMAAKGVTKEMAELLRMQNSVQSIYKIILERRLEIWQD